MLLRDGRPEFAVECKSGERRVAPACRYVRQRTEIPSQPSGGVWPLSLTRDTSSYDGPSAITKT